MMTPRFTGNDPLAAARQHLDFEAMAKDAPSAKTILYKAQTIVPMAPVKPWERVGKAGATLAVVLVLLFAPMIPTTTQLALVKVQFENTFTRSEAQQTVFEAARNLPPQLLAAAEFAEAPGQAADEDSGRLSLRLASLRLSPDELAGAALTSLESADGVQPFITPSTAAWHRSWQTIPGALISRFSSEQQRISYFPAANALASDIVRNSAMFESALAGHLAQNGYKLSSFSFTEFEARQPHDRDTFLLPAWPQWVSISISEYGSMPRLQQQELRSSAAEFLNGVLLGAGGIMLSDSPGPGLSVLLTVADRQGNADPVATRLVQAEFGTRAADNPPLGKFETEELVDQAVAAVLDGLDYKISYQQITLFEPGQSEDSYIATITISGKSRRVLKEFTLPDESEQDPVDF